VQCSAVQCSAVQCSAVQCSAVHQYNALVTGSRVPAGSDWCQCRNIGIIVRPFLVSVLLRPGESPAALILLPVCGTLPGGHNSIPASSLLPYRPVLVEGCVCENMALKECFSRGWVGNQTIWSSSENYIISPYLTCPYIILLSCRWRTLIQCSAVQYSAVQCFRTRSNNLM
jgi:hypothetical protein